MHKDTREILYTEEQIRDRSAELGKQISADYEGKDVLMVGLLKGSVPFFAELAKHVALDVEFDFMRVSSYEGTESTGNVIVKKDIDVDFKGKDILLVQAKYVGFEIPNAFVIGYGMDYNEKYRNLPYVGILKEEVYM